MNFKQALAEIESDNFAAKVNLASDFNTFLRIAEDQDAIQFALQELDSKNEQLDVYLRIYEISKQTVDIRYENPWDTALTIYVWLLSMKNPDLAFSASKIVSQIGQCWWAEKLSRHVIFRHQQYNESDIDEQSWYPLSTLARSSFKAENTGDVVLCSTFFAFEALADKLLNATFNMIVQADNTQNEDLQIYPPGLNYINSGASNTLL